MCSVHPTHTELGTLIHRLIPGGYQEDPRRIPRYCIRAHAWIDGRCHEAVVHASLKGQRREIPRSRKLDQRGRERLERC